MGTLSPSLLRFARCTSTSPAASYISAWRSKINYLVSSLSKKFNGNDKTPRVVEGITLRDYQLETIEKIREATERGLTRFGVSLPTGSGKTTVMMHSILQLRHLNWNSKIASGQLNSGEPKKVLVLVHKQDLIQQTINTARMALGSHITIEVEQGSRVASGTADLTVAMVQSLKTPARLAKYNPNTFGLVLVDEAHHAAFPTWLGILHHFNATIDNTDPPEHTPVTSPAHHHRVTVVGFSATFQRMDERNLSKAFEEIVHHVSPRTLIKKGFLVPVIGDIVHATLKLDNIKTKEDGDYNQVALSKIVNTYENNELLHRMLKEKTSERQFILIFCVCLKHLHDLTQHLQDAGVNARSISGSTPLKERARILEDFSNGVFRVLLNCEVLTEGTDIPAIDCVFLARPTKSPNLLTQMIGRGLRPSPSTRKEDCMIIDLVDNQSKIGSYHVFPELLSQLEREGQKLEDGEIVKRGQSTYTPDTLYKADDFRIQYISIDDPFGLNDDDNLIVEKRSKNAWVYCGKDLWVLDLMSHGYVAVECNNQISDSQIKWRSTWKERRPRKSGGDQERLEFMWSRPKIICETDDLAECIRISDQAIRADIPKVLNYNLRKEALWRKDQATENALRYLVSYADDNLQGLSLDSLKQGIIVTGGISTRVGFMTKGEVASLLCALSHGDNDLRDSIKIAESCKTDNIDNDHISKQEIKKCQEESVNKDARTAFLIKQGYTNTHILWKDTKDIMCRDNTQVI
ncbi:uncharacterized protein I206_102951 [Kwoniella pini CBS 10737]|uniref:DEAD box family helicase n=1 Tax=Kwoniella pini CBS 10737 TaxID=1296096 RepID=A0A1B9I6W5_9TREE|nr:uncharacterized protein I206_03303 [Kwoniella pini CBS 10737]OCF51236.1 hypothetical protein I206_03303 [Kwoniella pini CBS 10737]